MAINKSRFNVKHYGAKGDGTADDSAAFSACAAAIWNAFSNLPASPASGDGNRRANYSFYVPAGTYKITTSEAMMSGAFTTGGGPYMLGITYEGDGKYMSYINFQPTAADTFLLQNNNAFLHLSFRDMTFNGNSTANCCWLKSRAGIAQNYTYERVNWGGSWKYGIYLMGAASGTNLNSEQTFFHCNVNGLWNVFLHVPQSVGLSGDQFVNYNFYGCNMEVSGGSFIDMAYGGSVGIWGGSYMYYAGTSNGGTMFVFRNRIHNGGASRFIMSGTRIELPTAVCKMFHCEWGIGAVSFINVDNSTQQSLNDARVTGVNVEFEFGNDCGPAISFINCGLQGKHQYSYTQNHFERASRISYENCEIWHYKSPHEFATFVNDDGIYFGGAPQAKFSNCHGKPATDQSKYVWDTTLNWHLNRSGIGQKKILHLANPWNGGLPGVSGGVASSVDAFLPMNAIITSIRMYMAPGANSSTLGGWSFTVKDGNAATLATASPTTNPNLGMDFTSAPLWLICDTDNKRHITLAPNTTVNSTDPIGGCYIEYIG